MHQLQFMYLARSYLLFFPEPQYNYGILTGMLKLIRKATKHPLCFMMKSEIKTADIKTLNDNCLDNRGMSIIKSLDFSVVGLEKNVFSNFLGKNLRQKTNSFSSSD